jgi:hypothetical protein
MRRGGTPTGFTAGQSVKRADFARALALSACLACAGLFALPARAQHGEGHGQPGAEGSRGFQRSGPQFERGPGGDGFRPGVPGFRGRGGEHLPQWYAQHGGQSLQQQEQALRREPGFSRLPPGQQQQLINRLHRLDLQAPAMRQRMMERNEIFMALPQNQQSAIRRSSQMLRQMPPDRQHAVRQAFRNLRDMPPGEREQALDSARFQAEYSPQERDVMRNLLAIEPFPGQPYPGPGGPPPPR